MLITSVLQKHSLNLLRQNMASCLLTKVQNALRSADKNKCRTWDKELKTLFLRPGQGSSSYLQWFTNELMGFHCQTWALKACVMYIWPGMIHNDLICRGTRRSGVRWRKGSMIIELELAVAHILDWWQVWITGVQHDICTLIPSVLIVCYCVGSPCTCTEKS